MEILSEKVFGKVKLVRLTDYRYGVVTENGEIVVPFGKYVWIDYFERGLARVIKYTKDDPKPEKWGIINDKGMEVLPAEYDSIQGFYGKKSDATRVWKDGASKLVILNDPIEFKETLSEKAFGNVKLVRLADYRYGVVTENGEIVVPFGKYVWIDYFERGLARVIKYTKDDPKPEKWGIINDKGMEVLPAEYDSIQGFYGKKSDTTRAWKDGASKLVILNDPIEFKETLCEKAFGNVKLVRLADYRYGVVTENGEVVVPFGKYVWIDYFERGLARVIKYTKDDPKPEKWGIINDKGMEVLPAEYDSIWNFMNRDSTRVVKNGIVSTVFLRDLNPNLEYSRIANEKHRG